MSESKNAGRVVVQVIGTDREIRAEVERYLRQGGYAVAGSRMLPEDAQIVVVKPVIELTPRERDVLDALVLYDGDKQITMALRIGEKAVENHIPRLKEKLEVHSRHRLLLKAVQLGLIRLAPLP